MAGALTLILAIAAQAVVQSAPGPTASSAPAALDPAEVRRGFALVGPGASDEPALRRERQAREPSAGFRLGAALSAWSNATATLTYDLKTPSGDGGDEEAIGVDCYDERAAFTHLEAARQALGLAPAQATAAAGVGDGSLAPAWIARLSAGQPPRCR